MISKKKYATNDAIKNFGKYLEFERIKKFSELEHIHLTSYQKLIFSIRKALITDISVAHMFSTRKKSEVSHNCLENTQFNFE